MFAWRQFNLKIVRNVWKFTFTKYMPVNFVPFFSKEKPGPNKINVLEACLREKKRFYSVKNKIFAFLARCKTYSKTLLKSFCCCFVMDLSLLLLK